MIDEVPESSRAQNLNQDIALLGLSDFAAVVFISTAGNILNGRADNNAIITSGGADLSAGGSVGSSSSRTVNGTQYTGRITSTVSNVDAQALTGSIYLWNIGALVVGDVKNVATPYALYAPEGAIDVLTSSPLGDQPEHSGRRLDYQTGGHDCLGG